MKIITQSPFNSEHQCLKPFILLFNFGEVLLLFAENISEVILLRLAIQRVFFMMSLVCLKVSKFKEAISMLALN